MKTALTASAFMGFPTIIPATALGKGGKVAPSERARIAVIGCGGNSKSCWGYKHYGKSEIVAVCDPVLDRRLERAKEWGVTDHYNDFRELLAREDIDGVNICTGDYWHVPISLAAARAGKDVFCEKPLGLTIEQDLAAREITEKHNRIFQYGTQQRSSAVSRMGVELVLNGHIGEVKEVFVWAPGGATGGSATPVLDVPKGFDYDMFLGPAPHKPFCHDRCQTRSGTWFIYDFTIGFIAGWGAHPLDQLQWWADEMNLGIPEEYKTVGTIPTKGLFDTMTRWDMEAVYKDGLKLWYTDARTAFEKKQCPGIERMEKFDNCTVFVGEKGWVAISRGSLLTSDPELRRQAKNPGSKRLVVSTNHKGNFVDGILTREQPVSTLSSAVHSDIISQMGDIGARTGEILKWDPVNETVIGSADAKRMMHRDMRAPWTL
ncbi:Gfo/Idh/MocA family protein [Coraliomargarita akajimensis]|uniref:Oxidoreductase domain protein n=1 Tax=Coraliomargarita akajimensis (strain DSM 45221 / IAM 15411 / JCM 23193 / KCTC 12865 / 04OKA010-24) TaxID=583355 RepID=D5ENA2_CORAD|nr:Gfo/Idh/MocA family oxidoreductase [Coraliomargarita akajimensis]ADE53537.1 oxidoreductase domain protein [Coraliomargarita akajimensis DSM 45221]